MYELIGSYSDLKSVISASEYYELPLKDKHKYRLRQSESIASDNSSLFSNDDSFISTPSIDLGNSFDSSSSDNSPSVDFGGGDFGGGGSGGDW